MSEQKTEHEEREKHARISESPWAISVAQVATRPGKTQQVDTVMPAPDGVGDEYYGVPEGADVSVEGRIESLAEGLLFTGSATTRVVGQCGRCLKDISHDQTVDLQAYFPYDEAEANGDDDPFDGEEESADAYPLYEGGTVMSVEALIRDALVVSLPAQALCQPDCKGLCPECGVNLNENPEHHHEHQGTMWDGGLAALKAQLEREQGEES